MRVATRRELVAAIRGRYRIAARGEKQKILDEFVAVSGYHRKHAVRILGGAAVAGAEPAATVRRPCRYAPPGRLRRSPAVDRSNRRRCALVQSGESSAGLRYGRGRAADVWHRG